LDGIHQRASYKNSARVSRQTIQVDRYV